MSPHNVIAFGLPDDVPRPATDAAPAPPIPAPTSDEAPVETRESRVREFLRPENPIEETLVDQVAMGAGMLAKLSSAPDLDDKDWCSRQRLASSIFYRGLGYLERGRRSARAEKKAARPSALTRDEMLAVEINAFEPPEQTPEEIATAAREWREAIAVVPEITREFPVLLKTRRVIEWYLSFYGDGLSDRQIIKLDPRITYSDLAAMRACEAAGLNGPFDSRVQLPSMVPIRPLAACPLHLAPPPPDPRKLARAASLGTKTQPGWD